MNTATLLISCPDQKGLSAAIANFLFTYNANIVHSDQHQDSTDDLFLMRVEWDLTDFTLDMASFAPAFQPIADRFRMQWTVALSAERPRVAIFVSKYDHCLVDLLHRHQSGELACDIPLVISNHEDCRAVTEFYGVPFHVISVNKDNKAEAEAAQQALLRANQIDLIVLARYMQVLSHDFTAQWPQRVINIHHSFFCRPSTAPSLTTVPLPAASN